MAETKINEKYLEHYYANEADANKQMSFANLLGTITMLVIWMLYVFRVFPLHDSTYILVNIISPINIFILLSPLFFLKSERIKKPRYKYFLIFSFIFVISILNLVLPKHTLLGWALVIVMVNHYYNPKFGKIVFAVVMVMMLLCMYGGMFVGEYDPHFLGDGYVENGQIVTPDRAIDRYNMLHNMLINGDNRYLKVFLFYYVSRGAFLTLIFMVSNSLNRRTYNLLVKEIQVGAEQERSKSELNVAKDIQYSTLPRDFAFASNYEIQADLIAAKEVGGDFYDHVAIDDHHVAIAIGDVSGKGVPAAMFMMRTITCLRNALVAGKSPAEVLRSVNATLYEGNESKMFVTCFVAIIDLNNGHMRFANAGHNPPLINHGGKSFFLPCKHGFVLAGMPMALVVDEEITLAKGDTVLLYTDGVTECRNEKGEFYGEERFLSLMKDYGAHMVVHKQHQLKEDLHHFAGQAEQSDDITLLSFRYLPYAYDMVESAFPVIKEEVPKILSSLTGFCKKYQIDENFTRDLSDMVENLVRQSIERADEEDYGDIYMRMCYAKEANDFILAFARSAMQFNPFEMDGNDNDLARESRILKQAKGLMDECAYDYVGRKNVVVFKRTFTKEEYLSSAENFELLDD